VDAAKVLVGQNATLTFDAIPNLSLNGTVVDVSPLGTVTQGVVSYDVKIGFTTQDPRVKAGMTVDADIQSAVHSNVLEVPASAIQTSNGASYVLAFSPALSTTQTTGVTTSQTPVQIPVTIGITDNTNTEILSGLTQGEQIISRASGSNTASAASAATTRGGFGGGGGGAAGGAVLRGGL
jgi:multidrug efflux pump subunit AcrA (membrane-fusion protein)